MKKLFRFFWKDQIRGYKLVRVTGWRSCIVENNYGHRSHITFCVWGLK